MRRQTLRPELWHYNTLGEPGYQRCRITIVERQAVRQELRVVDMRYRNGYRMEWKVLVKRMMGKVTTTNSGLKFPDGTTRLNHHCHGPGQFELYGYRNWTACYEAVANRLSRLGSRELGHIERKAKRAYIQMFKASLWLASSTRNSKHKLLYAPTMDASAGSWETSLDDGRQIGDNRGRHLTVFGAPREVVHGVEKGAKTLTISQAHRCIGGYYADGQDSNAVMLRFTNAGKHQFGPTSGNGDYRIKKTECRGGDWTTVTLREGLRESIPEGTSVYVGRNRVRTAADQHEEIVETIYSCGCQRTEGKKKYHVRSCPRTYVSWRVFRQPAMSNHEGDLREDTEIESQTFGTFKVNHPVGCDCDWCGSG